MSKNKSMAYQVKQQLGNITCFGRSKHADKKPGNRFHPNGIYSVGTYNNYVNKCTAFCNWCKVTHGCRTVDACKSYITEYLDQYSPGKSAWSINTVKYAIQKLYDAREHGFKVDYVTPRRRRVDITKNRGEISDVKNFNEKKYTRELNFGCATGARRSAMLKLEYRDIYEKDGEVYVHFEKDKGGKTRDVKIMPRYREFIRTFIGQGAEHEKVFSRLPVRFPEHRCRRHFAQEYYSKLARDIKGIPESDRYICRFDKYGRVYDRKAMLAVSEALGHGRVDVMALHYLE